MLFLVALCLLSRPSGCATPLQSEYQLVYGHVLAQNLSISRSTPPGDVSQAVQIAQKIVYTRTGASTTVNDVSKSKLYFTIDGATPYLLEQQFVVSGLAYVQRMNIFLGFQYTITLTTTHAHINPQQCHRVTLTKDLNGDYHIFSHTHAECSHIITYSVRSEQCVAGHTTTGSAGSDISTKVCIDTCCHGTDYCSVCMDKEPALEGTCCASFHSGEPSEKQLHGDHCLPPGAEWTLTNHQSHCNTTQPSALPRRQSIRVATYNLWNLNGFEFESYRDRVGRLGKMLSLQDLDILAVQEVRFEARSDHTHNQIEELSQFLPDHHQYVFQPAMLYMERIDVRTEEGVAVFSKHPIIHSDYTLLYRNVSDEEDGHQRICLHVEILTPALGLVHVFVTHLSLSQPSQEKSVVEVWRYMSRFTGYKLLLGDLNAEPDSSPIRFLGGEVPLEGVFTGGLRDLWLEGGRKIDSGHTFSTLTHSPTKRIDYIFHQSRTSEVMVTDVAIMDEGDLCDLPCSDHHGVVATIARPPLH